MILSFKRQFVPKIVDATKIHTLRDDPHRRWRAGRKMHMATGVRTPHYHCFKEAHCTAVQEVYIDPPSGKVFVEGRELSPGTLQKFAQNDGFDTLEAFWQWFNEPTHKRLIHWTDLRY